MLEEIREVVTARALQRDFPIVTALAALAFVPDAVVARPGHDTPDARIAGWVEAAVVLLSRIGDIRAIIRFGPHAITVQVFGEGAAGVAGDREEAGLRHVVGEGIRVGLILGQQGVEIAFLFQLNDRRMAGQVRAVLYANRAHAVVACTEGRHDDGRVQAARVPGTISLQDHVALARKGRCLHV